MLSSCGIECWIEVDGKKCEEYDVEGAHEIALSRYTKADETLAKYIRLEADQNFAIGYCVSKSFQFATANAVRLTMKVDGSCTKGSIQVNDETLGTTLSVKGLSFTDEKLAWYCRNFTTSNLNVHENATKLDKEKAENIGLITISVKRVNALPSNSRSLSLPKDLASTQSASEKSLKGRDLSLRAGVADDAQPSAPITLMSCTDVDAQPFLEFAFRYRSRGTLADNIELIPDALERIGVIKPLEEQDPAELTPEQLREVISIQKRRMEEDRQELMRKKRRDRRGSRERSCPVARHETVSGCIDLT